MMKTRWIALAHLVTFVLSLWIPCWAEGGESDQENSSSYIKPSHYLRIERRDGERQQGQVYNRDLASGTVCVAGCPSQEEYSFQSYILVRAWDTNFASTKKSKDNWPQSYGKKLARLLELMYRQMTILRCDNRYLSASDKPKEVQPLSVNGVKYFLYPVTVQSREISDSTGLEPVATDVTSLQTCTDPPTECNIDDALQDTRSCPFDGCYCTIPAPSEAGGHEEDLRNRLQQGLVSGSFVENMPTTTAFTNLWELQEAGCQVATERTTLLFIYLDFNPCSSSLDFKSWGESIRDEYNRASEINCGSRSIKSVEFNINASCQQPDRETSQDCNVIVADVVFFSPDSQLFGTGDVPDSGLNTSLFYQEVRQSYLQQGYCLCSAFSKWNGNGDLSLENFGTVVQNTLNLAGDHDKNLCGEPKIIEVEQAECPQNYNRFTSYFVFAASVNPLQLPAEMGGKNLNALKNLYNTYNFRQCDPTFTRINNVRFVDATGNRRSLVAKDKGLRDLHHKRRLCDIYCLLDITENDSSSSETCIAQGCRRRQLLSNEHQDSLTPWVQRDLLVDPLAGTCYCPRGADRGQRMTPDELALQFNDAGLDFEMAAPVEYGEVPCPQLKDDSVTLLVELEHGSFGQLSQFAINGIEISCADAYNLLNKNGCNKGYVQVDGCKLEEYTGWVPPEKQNLALLTLFGTLDESAVGFFSASSRGLTTSQEVSRWNKENTPTTPPPPFLRILGETRKCICPFDDSIPGTESLVSPAQFTVSGVASIYLVSNDKCQCAKNGESPGWTIVNGELVWRLPFNTGFCQCSNGEPAENIPGAKPPCGTAVGAE